MTSKSSSLIAAGIEFFLDRLACENDAQICHVSPRIFDRLDNITKLLHSAPMSHNIIIYNHYKAIQKVFICFLYLRPRAIACLVK
jgi:hypothetical protein